MGAGKGQAGKGTKELDHEGWRGVEVRSAVCVEWIGRIRHHR